jgi:hypothetical protein
VYRVAAEFRQTGSIQGPKTRRKGYFRALDDACIRVCDFCAIDASIYCTQCYFQYLVGRIQQTPDVYLEELSEELRRHLGTRVSISTIWRALRAQGFTQKMVSCINPSFTITYHPVQVTKAARERDEIK